MAAIAEPDYEQHHGYDPNYKRSFGFRSILPSASFSMREVLIAGILVASLYLINGAHANTVCAIMTVVPAAVLTYKVLFSADSTAQGYKAMLFYWSLHGAFTVADSILSDATGYFLAKFVVMTYCFSHVTTANNNVFEELHTACVEITQNLTSVVSYYDSEGYPIHTPTPTAFSDTAHSSLFMPSTLTAAPMVNTSVPSMASTQHNSPMKLPVIQTSHIQPFTASPVSRPAGGPSLSTNSVMPAYGDIITNPLNMVVIPWNKSEDRHISVINVTDQNIIFALKTNAMHRLSASPTRGVIFSGQEISIRVGLAKSACMEDGDVLDKLAIDYCLVGSQRDMDPRIEQRTDRRRHLLRVSYAK